jgi:hypothetical protein
MDMDTLQTAKPKPGRPSAYARELRQSRILARLCDGAPCEDIARHEGLSVRRVREIVGTALKNRAGGDEATHVRLQIERLSPALSAASATLLRGDARAIRPLLKVLDQLDRYRRLAGAAEPPPAASNFSPTVAASH